MAWPATGATPATGVAATGVATTMLWGTEDLSAITGFAVITSARQQTLVAFEEEVSNGTGLTAGHIIAKNGAQWELEVKDDTRQVMTNLRVGQTVLVRDGAGLLGGRAGSYTTSNYTGIITGHDWNTAPKTSAGRTITVKNFTLIHPTAS
jgi:hypothetical protein